LHEGQQYTERDEYGDGEVVGEYWGYFIKGLYEFVEVFGGYDSGHGFGIVDAVARFVVAGGVAEEAAEPFRAVVVEACDGDS
jgi:hypothetical protein